MKRFLRDGYGTVYDKPGQYYEKAELKVRLFFI